MERLENKCIEKVIFYIESYYVICKRKNWKIPRKIGDKLFDYAYKYKCPLNGKHLQLFQSNITELSKFVSRTGNLNILYYDFLNQHQFEYVNLIYLKEFHLKSKETKFSTKSFYIKDSIFMDFDMEKMDYFFKNSIFIENSISVKNINNQQFFLSLTHALRQSLTSIYCLSFNQCTIENDTIKILSSAIAEISSLEIFKLKLNDSNKVTPLYSSIGRIDHHLIHSLRKSANNIKVISLSNFLASSSSVILLLKQLVNLEKLSISFILSSKNDQLSFDEIIDPNVFKVLRKNKLKNFKKLKLSNCSLNEEGASELIKFLNCSDSIENIHFYDILFKKNTTKNLVLECTKELSKNLKNLFIGNLCQSSTLGPFDNCSSLIKVKVFLLNSDWISSGVNHSLMKAISNSKETLQDITLGNINNSYLIPLLSVVHRIRCIKRFHISETEFCEISSKILADIINIQKHNLEKIKFTYTTFFYETDLFQSISNCSNLIHLTIFCQNSYQDLNYLIHSTSSFMTVLQYFDLIIHNLTESELLKIGKDLMICKSLRKFRIWNFSMGDLSFQTFNQQIQHLKPKLEIFNCQYFCTNSNETKFHKDSFFDQFNDFKKQRNEEEKIIEIDNDDPFSFIPFDIPGIL